MYIVQDSESDIKEIEHRLEISSDNNNKDNNSHPEKDKVDEFNDLIRKSMAPISDQPTSEQ